MPGVTLVTSTVIVQVPAASSPSLKAIVPPPFGAATVPRQLTPVVTLAGEAMVIPAGRTSVKATFSTEIDVVMVKLSVLALPGPMVSGANDLAIVTGVWAPAAGASARAHSSRVEKDQVRLDCGGLAMDDLGVYGFI